MGGRQRFVDLKLKLLPPGHLTAAGLLRRHRGFFRHNVVEGVQALGYAVDGTSFMISA